MVTYSVFLPGESHGQRNLEGYSQQGHKESDTTEVTEHTQLVHRATQGQNLVDPKKVLNCNHHI